MEDKPFKMKNPSLAKAMKEGTPMQLNYGSPAKKDKKDEVSYDEKSMSKKGKTRILVTHAVEFVHLADKIVIMNEGRI